MKLGVRTWKPAHPDAYGYGPSLWVAPVLENDAHEVEVTYPAEHVARGLGDTPEHERPLEATLWGEPACGRAVAKLADGTVIRYARGEWSVTPERDLSTARR
jgi:hypothetical protein